MYVLSCVRLLVTPWTVAHQAPLSVELPRQEHWSGYHFLLQGIFPTHGSNRRSLCLQHWQADPLPLHHHLVDYYYFCCYFHSLNITFFLLDDILKLFGMCRHVRVNWESAVQEYECSTFMTEIGRPFPGTGLSGSKGACRPTAPRLDRVRPGTQCPWRPTVSQRRALMEPGRPRPS